MPLEHLKVGCDSVLVRMHRWPLNRLLSLAVFVVILFAISCNNAKKSPAVTCMLLAFRDGTWYILPANGPQNDHPVKVGVFGESGDLPIVSDWDNTGRSRLGVFRKGTWFADVNDNAVYDPGNDRTFNFGADGDFPVAGDWDGSGVQRIGVFRNGLWFLDKSGDHKWDAANDRLGNFGQRGDIPVVGDWDGTGRARIGVFRDGQWYLDINGDFTWDPKTGDPKSDRVVSFGQPGDIPVVGDWDSTGRSRIGVFRKGQWYLDLNGNFVFDGPTVDRVVNFGEATDRPAVLMVRDEHK